MRQNIRSLFAFLLAMTLLGSASVAQAQLTRGTLSGTVIDSSGARVPGVIVSIVAQATGGLRRVTTSDEGLFRVGGLEPGRYTVSFEREGFAMVEERDVPVHSAAETTRTVLLAPAGFIEAVHVTADPASAAVGKANPTVALTLSSEHMENLPLSAGRDVTRLALLAPTVIHATGASPFAANGQRSRNNNFSVDGTDNNEMTISTYTMAVPAEAVAEVQVQTAPFNAEFGRNSGAQINVITRSGTNRLRGSGHEHYRGSALDAMSNLEKDSGLRAPSRFNQNVFGVGAGGALVHDRAFFYGLAQADRLRSASTLGETVRIPTAAGYAQLASVPLAAGQQAASRRAVLDRLEFLRELYASAPAFRNMQETLVNGVPIETGQVNVGRSTPGNALSLNGRVDVQWSSADRTTVRVARNKLVNDSAYSNVDFGSRFAADEDVLDRQMALSHVRILSPSMLNELRIGHVRRQLNFPERDAASPTATIGGFFSVGGTREFPQARLQDNLQLSNVLTVQRSRHGIKAGVDLRYISLDNLAAFDSKGTFTFNNLQDFLNNRASLYRQAVQTSSFEAGQWQTFAFAQDDWRLTPAAVVNLGLRYEVATVPLGFFGTTDSIVHEALVPGPLHVDRNNVAPRVGLTWSPSSDRGVGRLLFGDAKGALRTGYGVSYDLLFYNLLVLAAGNYPRVVNHDVNNAFDIYPSTTPGAASPVFSPTATFRNVPEDTQLPMNQYWSVNYQRQLHGAWSIELGYIGNRGRNGLTQLQANPAVLTAEQAAAVRVAEDPFVIPSVQARRLQPSLGSRILYAGVGRSAYHAGFVRVERHLARGLQAGASYTFSRSMSQSDELLALPAVAGASPQVPQDFADLDREWSVSAFDRPHRAVANWTYELPAAGRGVARALFSGWRVAGVFQAQSGQPFTILTGVDSNGNGAGGDRPNYDPSGILLADPRTGNLKSFTAMGVFQVPTADGSPLPNSLGNGNLGRNTLRAAAVFNWDLNVARRFSIGQHALTLRADLFNAFNQDDYGVPVNVMNDLSFGQNVNDWGHRSITLGARYEF